MKKIVYKGQQLTRVKVRNNILRIFEMATDDDKYDWYSIANQHAAAAAKDYNIPLSCAAGVLAALSPRKNWKVNIQLMHEMLSTGNCGQIGMFKKKASDIMKSEHSDIAILEILKGRKIQAFYMNIMYPKKSNYVTIDRHALSVAMGEWIDEDFYRGMTSRQYEFFVQCYIFAAMKAGVSPLLMQSATWVVWRKIKKQYK